jgi:hypothetical protein
MNFYLIRKILDLIKASNDANHIVFRGIYVDLIEFRIMLVMNLH